MDFALIDIPLAAFYLFAGAAVLSAVAVIGARNPVHSALFLVLAFFTVACTWILAGAEFLGLALVLVYVGAVMVLFLFVVMMLDIDIARMREGYVRYLPAGLVVAVVMLAEMLALIGVRARAAVPFADNAAQAAASEGNTTWLARALFTDFLLPFEVAAVILTVAVVAAVMLTLRRRVGAKHQDPLDQARVRSVDRVRIVKMDAVRPPPVAGDAQEPQP
jgi:NADH-quinone oxidoreductase subunit J